MRIINLSNKLSDAEADALEGTMLSDACYDTVIRESCDVYKPNGEVLLRFRKNVLDLELAKTAGACLRAAAARTHNRGAAGGLLDYGTNTKRKIADTNKFRYKPLKKNGTISRTSYAGKQISSGIIGFFDRYPRIPYCRTTAYNLKYPARFSAAVPLLQQISSVFASEEPVRHAAQMEIVKETHHDWIIHGTAFTTITVNKNWQTAVHKDAGDYAPGMGVMAVLENGLYDGGYLVFPAFRVAVDIRMGDVLISDVHEYHANTAMIGKSAGWERLSLICYYRANMKNCGSAVEEVESAKRRKIGMNMYE